MVFTGTETGKGTFWIDWIGSWFVFGFLDWTDNINFTREKWYCGKVSKGFVDQFNRIRDNMISHYHRLVKGGITINKILITGHSMGGLLFNF